ncbi:hypothetical protein [Maridesulfovibrio ferrireducens]|uniref:hypothetical protein n=1 Tax=Maridesulfovibrio ferrireducens TaxID=246191 RepID=UPI001A200681|nr:hypothetical protein [Maridesulfovibrio ferrireducens]MBI9110332.1 hypothetical protein [Maridesulfovibrio ferrireducens]
MRLIRLTSIFICCLLFVGCVKSKSINYYTDQKITGEKVIAFEGPRTPWTAPLLQELRKKGFKVKRWGSQHKTVHKSSDSNIEMYNEASTRYILFIDGQAYLNQANRCFGGGYKFVYINADLVDVESNETIANFSDAGYSENCPPFSGTIFEDIANTVNNAWE